MCDQGREHNEFIFYGDDGKRLLKMVGYSRFAYDHTDGKSKQQANNTLVGNADAVCAFKQTSDWLCALLASKTRWRTT